MQYEPTLACKLIKKELKTIFPEIKFSVTSQHGNANVYHSSDLKRDEILKHINKFKCGRFDSQTDSYDYYQNTENLPRVMYIFINRI